MNNKNEEIKKVAFIVKKYMKSLSEKDENISYEQWLIEEYSKEFPEKDIVEVEEISKAIINQLDENERSLKQLEEYSNKGLSRETFFADKMEEASKIYGKEVVQDYVNALDVEIRNQENYVNSLVVEEAKHSLEEKVNAEEEYVKISYRSEPVEFTVESKNVGTEKKDILETSLSSEGVRSITNYFNNIDTTISNANSLMQETVYTKSGLINQGNNLDGFIAESHHVNTYNIDAATKNINSKAEVLMPKAGETYGKNSVDTVIKDSDGLIRRKYQAKYGQDSKATEKLFDHGDYKGQRKLAPSDQIEKIQDNYSNATDVMEYDGASSKKLSKTEAKEMQKDIQEKGEIKKYSYDDVNFGNITKEIARKTAYSFAGGAAIGMGAKIVGDIFKGEDIDKEEVVIEGLKTGSDFGVKTALAGALNVAGRRGVMGALSNTNVATGVAFTGVEMAKAAWRCVEGDMSSLEALDTISDAGVAAASGISLAGKGAAAGAAIGAALGPVGATLGGVIGGTVGYISGSAIGKAVSRGAKSVASSIGSAISSVGSAISSIGSAIGSFFGW